jgi:hypothetical protein
MNAGKRAGNSEILLYQTEDGKSRVEVRIQEETVWLNQAAMVELFQTTKQNVSLHLKNIYQEGELSRQATVKECLTVRKEGKRHVERHVEHYNLEAIIAVGYRVKSHRGTQFRKWATERLREYLVKGFVLDDERLKEGRNLGTDYFDELLERIRDIRASEKRFYQKIRDLYKLSIDYDSNLAATQEFFQIVQNKLHWAVAGKTAAEIIAKRADAAQPNMGLTTWKGAKVRRADVTVAKNYLSHDEISGLNRIVVMYLDYAEDQAKQRRPLYMRDWREKLDAFLRFNERQILDHPGKVAMAAAQQLALKEYDSFHKQRLEGESIREEDEFEQLTKKMKPKSRSGR